MKITEYMDCLCDNDVQFEMESKEKKGHFLSIYTMDTKLMRGLTNKKGADPFEGYTEIGEYCDTYEINFYTEYYPHTEEVAVKMSLCVYDVTISKAFDEIMKGCDRVKDGYIQLTDEEKEIIRSAAKEYVAEEIEYFFEYEAEQEVC